MKNFSNPVKSDICNAWNYFRDDYSIFHDSPPKAKKRRRELTNARNSALFPTQPDEIIDDSPDDDQFVEQLVQSYAKGPEVDSDAGDVPVPTPISIPQALGILTTVRTFAEQQKRDHRDLIRQLEILEREMKAL
jgi:hypothetical protein